MSDQPGINTDVATTTGFLWGTTITRQAVTKHLRVLAAAGLARCEKSGRETVWALDRRPLVKARDQLDRIARQWDDAIERLRAYVEDDG